MVLVGAGVLTAACRPRWQAPVLLVLTAVLAAACYVKLVGQVLVVVPVLPLAPGDPLRGLDRRATVLVAAVVVVCILPWMLRATRIGTASSR